MRLIACCYYDYDWGTYRTSITNVEENEDLAEHVDEFGDDIFFFVSLYED